MDEIALAAGISRKALFLYFPSKIDLIWHRDGPFAQSLRDDIGVGGPDPTDAVATAIVAGFRNAPSDSATLQAQVVLHASDAAVRELVESRGMAWRDIVAERFTRAGTPRVDADIVAYGFWRTMWSGLEHWSTLEQQADPAGEVRSALSRYEPMARLISHVTAQ